MQAIAKFDFKASESDELSFSQGAILKVVSMEYDANWYKAEMHGRIGYVPRTYIEMKAHEWFFGKVSRSEAEKILLRRQPNGMYVQPDGAFLVRYCESSPDDISISVKYRDGVQHYKVLRDQTGKYYLWIVKFDSVNELIDYHRTSSVSRSNNIPLRDMIMDDFSMEVSPHHIGSAESAPSSSLQHHHQQQQHSRFISLEANNKPNNVQFNYQKQRVPNQADNIQFAIALYDFEPQEKGEIPLKKGDNVKVMSHFDDNWLNGECNGKFGLFPAAYIQITSW